MWGLALANPWVRLIGGVAIALVVGFSAGFLKGYGVANADYWRAQALAERKAAENKERLARADAQRAQVAQAERDDIERRLEAVIRETETAACKLSRSELLRLHNLASGKR